MAKKYCYSHDGERYDGSYDSRADALEEGRDDAETMGEEGPVYTGIATPHTIGEYVNLDSVMDDAQSCADDEMSEFAEDWQPVASPEAEAEFVAFIEAWATKHKLQPHFFSVDHVEEHPAEVSP